MSLRDLGVLQIEPTDTCNLRCSMCAPHYESWDSVHNISKGFLDVELWKSIVAGLVNDNLHFDHLIFQWLGEPLLHPQIINLIDIASVHLASSVQYFRMDTNAILFTPNRIDKLCQIALRSRIPILVVCTIDAHTPHVYKEVKGADKLFLVRKNILHLLQTRHRLGASCLLNVQIQFVVQKANAHESYSFLYYWKSVFEKWGGLWHDELMFKRLSVGGGADGQAAADILYEKSILQSGISSKQYGPLHVLCWENRPWQHDDGHDSTRSACPALWMTPVIRHDGSLMMCCADLQGELNLGSLSERSFSDLWFGKKAQEKRKEHLAGIFSGVCYHCGGINWYSLSEDRLLFFQEEAERRISE